jgi:hypothetical protein
LLVRSGASPEPQVPPTPALGQRTSGPLQWRGLCGIQREGHRWQDLYGQFEQQPPGRGGAVGPTVDSPVALQPPDLRVSCAPPSAQALPQRVAASTCFLRELYV